MVWRGDANGGELGCVCEYIILAAIELGGLKNENILLSIPINFVLSQTVKIY